jgi:hypothetical protein
VAGASLSHRIEADADPLVNRSLVEHRRSGSSADNRHSGGCHAPIKSGITTRSTVRVSPDAGWAPLTVESTGRTGVGVHAGAVLLAEAAVRCSGRWPQTRRLPGDRRDRPRPGAAVERCGRARSRASRPGSSARHRSQSWSISTPTLISARPDDERGGEGRGRFGFHRLQRRQTTGLTLLSASVA